jgi:hypothetical protein
MALLYSSLAALRNTVKRAEYNLFMHFPIDGYLGYFQFFAPANNAATNNYVRCPDGT